MLSVTHTHSLPSSTAADNTHFCFSRMSVMCSSHCGAEKWRAHSHVHISSCVGGVQTQTPLFLKLWSGLIHLNSLCFWGRKGFCMFACSFQFFITVAFVWFGYKGGLCNRSNVEIEPTMPAFLHWVNYQLSDGIKLFCKLFLKFQTACIKCVNIFPPINPLTGFGCQSVHHSPFSIIIVYSMIQYTSSYCTWYQHMKLF